MLVTFGFGAIGWVDDWRKVVQQEPRGHALAREVLLAVADRPGRRAVPGVQRLRDLQPARARALPALGAAAASPTTCRRKADLMVPFFKTISYPLGVFGFIALTYFVIVGASNAVNLTDGLDGLAIMPVVMVGSALGVFAYITGNAVYSQLPAVPVHPGRRRAAGLLRRDGRRRAGLPVVQRPPGAGLHGRRRRAGAGRRAGHHRRHHAPGDRARHHGRHLRRRGAVGDGAGGLVQVHEEALRRRAGASS